MTKHSSALILSLIVILAMFIYGCCSHSKDGFYVNPVKDAVMTERFVVIDDLGRLPTVSFPSGIRITGAEENTLQPVIKVYLTEQGISSQNTAYFNESDQYIYIYRITAFQEPSNSAGSKAYVTTIEKPFIVTLPINVETGRCYFGIRETEADPWRFMRVGDSNEITANEYSFNLHRLSTTFCFVVFRDKNIPETVVDSIIASQTVSVLVKNSKYLEDISLKGILKGNRLDSINPTDLMARITYRNNKADEAPIKVNGVNVTQTSKADKTVPGYTYYHSFEVDSFLESNLLGTSGEYTFTLNTSGIEIDSFPTGFLIEFYN